MPLPFFAMGLAGLLATPLVALIDPAVALSDHPGPAGLLFLHLITLGFLAPVMIGAYYQLVPVVLGAPIRRPGWARVIFAALVAGVFVFLLGWGVRSPAAIGWGGLLTGLALWGFVVHVGASLVRVRRLTPTALAFALALAALAAVGVLGPLLALRIGAGLLPAHVAAGLGGWLLLTIIGATYQLVPFFAAAAAPPRFGIAAVVLVAVGTVAAALGAGVWVGLAGLALWAADLVRFARSGRQTRREPVVLYTLAAAGLLILAAAGIQTGLPARVLVLAGLLAGPALMVMGQLQKILPFLAALDAPPGARPKTEQLFSRQAAARLLPLAAAGLLGLAVASGFASALGVRLAATVATAAIAAYLLQQRPAVTSRSSRRPPPARSR
ncbi:MAG TPA: hypothetical protein VNM16_04155 [Bacillota bacterium]|nr:hypothetical protein [Bacillota bacterium]